MRQSILYAVAALLCGSVASPASAAIVFGLQRVLPGPSNPSQLQFRVTLSQNGGGILNDTAGVNFSINAADPFLSGTRTEGGRFVSGAGTLFEAGAGFQYPFPSSAQIFSGNQIASGVPLTSVPITIATLTLDLTGGVTGTYTLQMGDLQAVDTTFNSLPVAPAPSLTYTVPEPTTLALPVGAGVLALRRSRQRAV
jgi:hypothetical protein